MFSLLFYFSFFLFHTHNVGDSHKGPLNNQANPLKTYKKRKS
jgi:hypothetical protein